MRDVDTMAADARNVLIPDEEWKEVGEIADAVERSRSWVIAKLISGAHDKVFRQTANGPHYTDRKILEDFGLR